MVTLTAGQDRERSAIDDKYKWNLADIYPDLAAWRAAKEAATRELQGLRAYEGKLGSSAQLLADALEDMSRLDKAIGRLAVYAGMLADQDTREAGPQGMQQEMQQLMADFKAQTSYVEPELLRVGLDTLERCIAAEPRLATYAFSLHDIARRARHTLSDGEEKILADAMPLASSGHNVYNILANADFPYPTITLSDGRTARVDASGYAELRTLPNRADREKAMSTFFTSLGSFSRTFGTMMNANVQRVAFYAKTRKYASHLEAALDGPNIPVSVYTRLIDGINRWLPSFHRYLSLRRRMMKLQDPLRYHDLYAPLVAEVELTFTPEEAQQDIIDAMRPLGPAYCGVVQRSFSERWIDFFPTVGKRAGAYSEGGAYDVHPYMLLNYLGQYNDVSTLAHELGHTMHSYYSNTVQPYALANYPTFVAEVASTFNEALLIDRVLRNTKDPATRLSLLGSFLENVKATVFRQTQFAEFELKMHQLAERGEPITGEALGTLYLDIARRYYGNTAETCIVDDYVRHEWSYIPHFYIGFYVFQYATSFTAAEALSEKVLAGDEDARTRYLTFLGSGTSKYPIDLLKDAGVDMTTDEPLDFTMRKMNRVMDEIEARL
ncbi:MAG TPA: oligoendopeptidase F [Vicinamibacterales bacterium]|jgi:oligoendopeptidase F